MSQSITRKDKEERFADLFAIAQRLIGKWAEAPRFATVKIDRTLLFAAVESAMFDIERYKQFHLLDPMTMKSDSVKRAAFMTHWLRRFRPIYVEDRGVLGHSNDPLFLANEYFCLLVSCSYLSADVEMDVSLTEQKTEELIYNLLYRDITPDGLILFFQTVKDLALKENVFVFD